MNTTVHHFPTRSGQRPVCADNSQPVRVGAFSMFGHTTLASKNRELRKERMRAARLKGTHTDGEWRALRNEFKNVCVRCQSAGLRVERDHIVPIYLGGSDSIENIQPLCARCNASKGRESINWVAIRRSERAHHGMA